LKFLAVRLGFPGAILLIVIVGVVQSGRRENRYCILLPHVGLKRGVGKELHLVSRADAVTWMTRLRSPRRWRVSSLPNVSQKNPAPLARVMAHRTPAKAELFCEIRMECARRRREDFRTRDGRHCLIFPDFTEQPEGVLRNR
jgi:hypothetical protein